MSDWFGARWALFDLETTGTDPEEARIVTAALVRVMGDEATDCRSWIVDPGIEIPAEAAAIHGYTTERIRSEAGVLTAVDGVDLVAAEVALALLHGQPVVAHNAPYDLTVLDRDCRRHGLPTLADRLDGRPLAPILDTLILDRQACPKRRRVSPTQGARQLVTLAQVYGVELDGAHNSAADAFAAGRVLYRIGEKYPHLRAMTAAQLHDAQVLWSAKQAAGFQAWLRANGESDAVIDGTWPVKPLPALEGVA
jgi:DNA polymerase-3 subunit epsilon